MHGALPVLFCNRRLQYNPLCVSQQWHASAWRGYSCAFVPHGGSRRPLEGGGLLVLEGREGEGSCSLWSNAMCTAVIQHALHWSLCKYWPKVLCAFCAHYCPRVLCALCTQPRVLSASTFAVFSSSGWNLTVASSPITNLIFPNIARVSLIDHSILFARSCVALLCLGVATNALAIGKKCNPAL